MGNSLAARHIYNRITKKKGSLILILALSILSTLVINIFVGSAGLSFSETIKSILMTSTNRNQTIIWHFRMPVALSAIFIGAALGMGGCEMQTILGNPMASPYTLGISAAASFGAAMAIVLKISALPILNSAFISLNSFMFTLVASFIIVTFSKRFTASRSILILFGISLNFLFNSLTTFLQYIANENDLQSLVFWTFGDLSKIGWGKLGVIVAVTILIFFKFASNTWQLTIMSLGDINAESLGIDVDKTRRSTIILVSLLSATVVSFAGTIGFIGLVAPHIARMVAGEDQRFFLPMSALMGALILSTASILSKIIIPGTILPIGLVTSLIGIPFFTYLIIKRKENYM